VIQTNHESGSDSRANHVMMWILIEAKAQGALTAVKIARKLAQAGSANMRRPRLSPDVKPH